MHAAMRTETSDVIYNFQTHAQLLTVSKSFKNQLFGLPSV